MGLPIVCGATYELLLHSTAALVCSGTATLETACLGTPQVVLYKTPLPRLARWVWDHLFKVRYISLVNLIVGGELVAEMFADRFKERLIVEELRRVLPPNSLDYSLLLQSLSTNHA